MSIRFVYVAGPMTKGDWQGNVRAAVDAADLLAEAGFVPEVPHLNSTWHLIHSHDHAFWMRLALAKLERCDALLRLPGESKDGADVEEALAKSLGLVVVAPEELEGVPRAIGILSAERDDPAGVDRKQPLVIREAGGRLVSLDGVACVECERRPTLDADADAELAPTRPRGLQVLDMLSNVAVRLARLEQQHSGWKQDAGPCDGDHPMPACPDVGCWHRGECDDCDTPGMELHTQVGRMELLCPGCHPRAERIREQNEVRNKGANAP